MRLPVAFLLLSLPSAAFAGREARDAALPLTNAEAALSAVAANPPLPMTYFEQGEYKMTVMANYFSMTTPAVPEDQVSSIALDGSQKGFGAGVLFDRALTDRWSLFLLALGARVGDSVLVGDATAEVSNSDTLFQNSSGGGTYSVSAAVGLNRRLYGTEREGFALNAFFGPILFYTRGTGRVNMLNNKTAADSTGCHQAFAGYNCIVRNYTASLFDAGLMAGLQAQVPLFKGFAINPYLFFMPATNLIDPHGKTPVSLDKAMTFDSESGIQTKSDISPIRGISWISLGMNMKYIPWGLGVNVTGSFVTPLLAAAADLDSYSMLKIQISRSFGNK